MIIKADNEILLQKSFQDEYRQGAVVKSMSFQTTYVDNQIEDDDPIKNVMGDYEVKINITPKGEGDKGLDVMESIRNYIKQRFFGAENYKKQLEFDKCTVKTENKTPNHGRLLIGI